VTANLRWLAGYRHPRRRVPATIAALRRGRDHAGVALAELPMTRPETVRSYPGLYRLSGFSFELDL
jgi:hypothetical protein